MWNNYECTTSEEETVNHSFSTQSLFKISADDPVTNNPLVQAIAQHNKIVVAIDQNLILLEDENNSKCSFLSFESKIDQLAISQSGNIIICALSDGNICGIYIKGFPVFKLTINRNDIKSPNKTFIGIQPLGHSYYVTCSNGIIYCISNINEDALQSCLNNSIHENDTYVFDQTLNENVKLDRITKIVNSNQITASTLIPVIFEENYKDFLLIGGTQHYFKFQNSVEDIKIIIPEMYQGIKNIFNLENYVLALTNNGHLIEICPYAQIFFHNFTHDEDYLIDNLIVVENNNDSIELLILTKPNDLDLRKMKIIEFPSFKCIQELHVSQYTWLVNQPKNSVNLYYLCGDKYNNNNFPQEIEMKLVSETQPEDRLKKLIQKGCFEEAELFGKQFKLNLQSIYEAKAKRLLTEISKISENNMDLMEMKFNELLTTLKQVENKDFFIGIRSIEIPSRKIMAQYLNEMLEHLKDGDYEEDILEIKEQQLRLETLHIIDPYECNLQWQKFVQHRNIIKEVTSLFKTDTLIAALIWKRHSASIIPNLNETSIKRFLEMIPSEIEPFNIIQWLRHFIPSIIQIHPKIMSFLIEWNLQKIRSLQYSNYWPEIGLEFSRKVVQIFEDIQFLHCDINRQYESSMQKLRNLENALQDLSVIKKSYNLILTLDNYLNDSIDDTSLHILQRLQTDILQQFVKDYLNPIYMERGQSPINALIKYIKFLVLHRNGLTTWLERAIILIDLLHNEEEKLNCALMVLKAAPVPWPEIVNPLINLRNSGHPLGIEINTVYELQIISIMKVKYGWPIDATENNMKLVFRIVATDLPDMFEDIHNLTKSDEELKLIANFYCCYELARKGRIDKAITYFNKLDDKEKNECSEKIINILSNIFEDSDDIDSTTNDGHYELLKLILPYSNDTDKKRINGLLIKRIVYQKFELKIKQNQLTNKIKCGELLHRGIQNFVDNLKKSPNDKNLIKYIWNELILLTNALNLENLVGIIELSKLIKNIHLTSVLAYNVIEMLECNTLNYDLFIELAVLLLSQQLLIYWDGIEEVFDPLSFPLAYKLLVKSLKINKNFEKMNKLLKWIEIGTSIYDLDIIENNFRNIETINENISISFKVCLNNSLEKRKTAHESISIFDEITVYKDQHARKSIVDPNPILRCVSFALLFVLTKSTQQEEIFLLFKKYLTDNIFKSNEELTKKFYTSLEHLVKSKQHNSWYTIAQYLLKDQENDKIKFIAPTFVSMQLKKMFRHLLTHKDVNFTDLFSMLICHSPANLLENLWQELKTDQQKINFLYLSEIYFMHTGNMLKVKENRECRLKHYYYTELCKQDSSLNKKTDIDMISFTQLIKELKTKFLDVKLLQRLSNDFDWDYQSLLISQIRTILHYQELNFELKTDAFGTEHLIVKTTVEGIHKLCQPYINEVKNTELLAKNLINFYNNINYYFYELYLCVIEMLTYINALPKAMELHANILIFLKHKMITKRKTRPGHIEVEAWLKFQSEGGVLPKISKYRLPFTPIVEKPLKDILDYEINVDNCESWFPLIKLHTSLGKNTSESEILRHQDYFCMSSVKKAVSEYSQRNDSDEYHLQPINNAFLQSILRLIRHVSDKSKAFHIIYFVANSSPDGADQVEAAYECYKYAMEHESELMIMENTKETIEKIRRKYPIFKIQHLLHIYDLVDEKLLQLVECPKELINVLYYHESLLKPTHPDINKIAKEIALLHDLDILEIQLKLLQKLLSFHSSTDVQDLEETFYEDLNTSENQTEDLNTDFVFRAHYILSSWDSDKAMLFLIGHIFPADGSVNTGRQLQLYECFAQLINDLNANSEYIDILNQNQYIIFKCVYNLKHLGFNFTIDKFADYDKLNLLKKIWQNHRTNSLAMEVIADICLGFDIHSPKIWNVVLQQMVHLNMLKQLNALVDILSCKIELLHTDGLTMAWEYVLWLPFKSANRTRSFEQEELLSKSLFRIQGCPVVNKINLIAIAENCIHLGRPHLAAVLLGFCSDNSKKNTIKMLLLPHKNESLKKDIIELEESGIIRNILNYVIQEIDL